MTAAPAARPRAVLVHGVGVGPWSYDALAADLAGDHEVVVAHRRGYGTGARRPLATSLDEHVDDLVGLAGGRAAFVGVSGGATLVLALAIAHPHVVAGAVVHEPLVGPLAPELHDQVVDAADRLSATADVSAFMGALVGPSTWAALGPAQRADVRRRSAIVKAEVPLFVAFAPTADHLRSLAGLSLVSSVGGASPSSRRAAATAVAAHTGVSPLVLPGVGHLAQLEAPAALAGALRGLQGGAGRHHEILSAGRRHQLEPDG